MTNLMTAIQAFYGLIHGTIMWSDIKHQSPSLYQVMVRWTTEAAYIQARVIEAEERHYQEQTDEQADLDDQEDEQADKKYEWTIWDYINQLEKEKRKSYLKLVAEQIDREEQKTRRQRRISKRLYKRRLLQKSRNYLGQNVYGSRLFDEDRGALANWGLGSRHDTTRGYEMIPLAEAPFQGTPLWQIESDLTNNRADSMDMEDRREERGKFNLRKSALTDFNERVNDWLAGDLIDRPESTAEKANTDKQAAEIRQQIAKKQQRINELNSLLMPEDGRQVRQQYGSFNRTLRQEMNHLLTDIEKLRKYAA